MKYYSRILVVYVWPHTGSKPTSAIERFLFLVMQRLMSEGIANGYMYINRILYSYLMTGVIVVKHSRTVTQVEGSSLAQCAKCRNPLHSRDLAISESSTHYKI